MRLRCFMKRIIKAIQDWYRGDNGEYEYNFELQVYEYARQPYRHWTAKVASYFWEPLAAIWRAISRNPNTFITQLFAFLALVLAATSLYLQFYKNDKKYDRCTITSTSENTVNIKCRK